jgi:HSP20 family molecular chaperone IbpA
MSNKNVLHDAETSKDSNTKEEYQHDYLYSSYYAHFERSIPFPDHPK